MDKDPFVKLQSSQTFEELMEDSHKTANQNWLISYLDVFVLILMFIITLIALSDFSIETETKALIAAPKAIKKPKPALPKAERIIEEPPQAIKTKAEPTAAPFIGPPKPSIEKPEESVVIDKITPDIEPEETTLKTELETTSQETLQIKLSKKLEQMGLDKSVAIKVTEDYAQLEIQDNILFESSQANLTNPGKHLLDGLMPLLQKAVGLIFIEGHTDNRPITTVQFPSNWELGAARATSVLHYLTTQGLESARMRAVTYADTQPIADNDTPEGRQMNRRVNILIKVKE